MSLSVLPLLIMKPSDPSTNPDNRPHLLTGTTINRRR
jgi:hypothetical protein